MKKSLLTILAIYFSFIAFPATGSDILTLNNSLRFEGKFLKIKNCKVSFQSKEILYQIPADDIYMMEFENLEDEVLNSYLADAQENCLKGSGDAAQFHGKKGGHIVLGILFGPFAVIGAALANPTPMKGVNTVALSKNQDLFADPAYLACYKKKAKGRNAGHAALGWGIWIILYAVISSGN
jgi:hypothetical protein